MYSLDYAIATVIVIALVAYAVWATFRLDAQSATIADLRELLRMYQNEKLDFDNFISESVQYALNDANQRIANMQSQLDEANQWIDANTKAEDWIV